MHERKDYMRSMTLPVLHSRFSRLSVEFINIPIPIIWSINCIQIAINFHNGTIHSPEKIFWWMWKFKKQRNYHLKYMEVKKKKKVCGSYPKNKQWKKKYWKNLLNLYKIEGHGTWALTIHLPPCPILLSEWQKLCSRQMETKCGASFPLRFQSRNTAFHEKV